MTTEYLQTEQGKIGYDDSGDNDKNLSNPVLICMPGMGDLRSQYRHLSKYLIEANYRVVTTELRGLGESEGTWKEFTPKDSGIDAMTLIKFLNIDSSRGVVMIGNSFSAASTVWVGAELPEIVKALVLTGPFVRDHPLNIFTKGLLKVLFSGPWAAASWTSYYKSLYITHPPEDLDNHIKNLSANLHQNGRMHTLNKQLWASKQPCTERIDDIKVPVLVLMGEKDPDFKHPQTEVDWIVQNFKNTKVHGVIVDKAGHYPQSEYPEIVSSEIQKFLGTIQ